MKIGDWKTEPDIENLHIHTGLPLWRVRILTNEYQDAMFRQKSITRVEILKLRRSKIHARFTHNNKNKDQRKNKERKCSEVIKRYGITIMGNRFVKRKELKSKAGRPMH